MLLCSACAQASVDYEAIYNEYMNSGAWNPGVGYVIEESEIIDINNDGVPELLLYTKNSESWERVSQFCSIKNGRVEALLEGYDCGGTAGGDEVIVMYDTKTSKYVVGTTGIINGYNRCTSWNELYNYSKGELIRVTKYSWDLEYFDPDYHFGDDPGITVYKIDDKQVTQEEYEAVFSRFVERENS